LPGANDEEFHEEGTRKMLLGLTIIFIALVKIAGEEQHSRDFVD